MAQHQSLSGGSRKSPASPPRLTATRRLLAILALVIPLIGGPITSVQAATAITFTGAELLGRPTDSSIMITIVPASTIEYYYEYGTESGHLTEQTELAIATGGQPGKVVIDELEANIRYYYRMKYHLPGEGDWVTRDERSFWTQREKGSTFKFDVTSDSHVNIMLGYADIWRQTMTNVAADHPDFHLDLGDTFAMDNVTTVAGAESAYRYQYQFFNLVSHSASIFLAPGNHEQQEGWHLDDTADPALAKPITGTNAQKKYFPNPVPDAFYSGNTDPHPLLSGDQLREDYYAWTWGDALFVVFDPFWYTMNKPFIGTTGGGESYAGTGDRWDWTLGQEQFDWLKQTLENSNARYKFLFAHHMVGGSDDYVRGGAEPAHLVEWGGHNEAGTIYEWETKRSGWGSDPIRQILVDNHVSAFFHGHDHQYAHEMRDGVIYESLPAAGFSGNGFNIYNKSPYALEVLPSPGHLRVTVTPEQATVAYIATTGGGVNYSYAIEPAPILTTAVSPPEGGTIDPAAGAHDYGKDAIVSVTAAPAAGYIFDYWSGDCTGFGACLVTMSGDRSVTAHFTAFDVSIAGSAAPDQHAVLDWTHLATSVDHYEVHRSSIAPYFAPGGAESEKLEPDLFPAGAPEAMTFPDPEVDLSATGATFYYAVVPVNEDGDPIGSSNRTAAFVYGLIPGAGS